MSRLFTTRRICFILLLGAGFGAGCGGPASVATVPVTGKVTLDGQPVTSGQVSFFAADAKAGVGLCTGIIDANGEYKIFSDGKPGAPLGKYKVMVMPSMVPPTGGGALARPQNDKYSDAKSTTLSVEVVSSPAPGAYDLKMTTK
jgi:hypothetical protein